MPERRLVNAENIRPTIIMPCQYGRIALLRPVFQSGQEAVNTTIEPVHIIAVGEETLLFDGNHRLTLGSAYGLLVPAFIYTVGQIIEADEHSTIVDHNTIASARNYRQLAKEKGFKSFTDLAILL